MTRGVPAAQENNVSDFGAQDIESKVAEIDIKTSFGRDLRRSQVSAEQFVARLGFYLSRRNLKRRHGFDFFVRFVSVFC